MRFLSLIAEFVDAKALHDAGGNPAPGERARGAEEIAVDIERDLRAMVKGTSE